MQRENQTKQVDVDNVAKETTGDLCLHNTRRALTEIPEHYLPAQQRTNVNKVASTIYANNDGDVIKTHRRVTVSVGSQFTVKQKNVNFLAKNRLFICHPRYDRHVDAHVCSPTAATWGTIFARRCFVFAISCYQSADPVRTRYCQFGAFVFCVDVEKLD
ncbi:hypothetical protein GWI33_003588 [Rhynchophorus ferrugineus]|uniref:Uncharacterized protein n=1 Tax=Rhynchophorus ferrugineus TaxID=354439 RepID=A0A834IMY9_RHYFE|nr:hypothetical protein GWI33_003588 [Rhynchophorus ferrugineus]